MSEGNVVWLATHKQSNEGDRGPDRARLRPRSEQARTGDSLAEPTSATADSLQRQPSFLLQSDFLFLRQQVEEIITDMIDVLDELDSRYADLEPDTDGEARLDDEASGQPEWRPAKTVQLRPLGRRTMNTPSSGPKSA